MGRTPAGERAEARDRSSAGPHARDLLRNAGDARGQHRHDPAVRPPRQAARIRRLARRPRPVDAEVRERQAVRPRRRGRRLCDLRESRGARRARRAGRRTAALRRPDRDVRGVGQLRSAAVRRRAARPARPGIARRVPRFRRRQLRPDVAHDVVARAGVRRSAGGGARRRHSFGRVRRYRAVELPRDAAAVRAPRGRRQRQPAAARVPLRDSRQPRARSRCGRGHPRRCGMEGPAVGLRRGRQAGAADHDRPARGAAEFDVAAVAVGDRRVRVAGARRRGQRAAAAHRVQAVAAPAAARRRRAGRAAVEGTARTRSAVQRARHVQAGCGRRDRLERARSRAVARVVARCRVAPPLRRSVRVHGPRRHDPADERVAGRLPVGAVHGVRRAGAEVERARAERVPARAVCEEADRGGRGRDRFRSLSAMAGRSGRRRSEPLESCR
ncbi:hypothetical protein BVI2075_270026 [Burkholderia vietnamiensis]|nr:hypothetical protein BVI2075_270026 [Burkholderia vietnamiensis]